MAFRSALLLVFLSLVLRPVPGPEAAIPAMPALEAPDYAKDAVPCGAPGGTHLLDCPKCLAGGCLKLLAPGFGTTLARSGGPFAADPWERPAGLAVRAHRAVRLARGPPA